MENEKEIIKPQIYALKVYVGGEELSLFDREFKVLMKLKNGHLNIVKAFNAKLLTIDPLPMSNDLTSQSSKRMNELKSNPMHSTIAYLVLEYCPAEDLFAYVKSGVTRLNFKLSYTLFLQVLFGLNYMHTSCGVAHLDIKLENIVVDKKFNLKLIDFAFSEIKDSVLW